MLLEYACVMHFFIVDILPVGSMCFRLVIKICGIMNRFIMFGKQQIKHGFFFWKNIFYFQHNRIKAVRGFFWEKNILFFNLVSIEGYICTWFKNVPIFSDIRHADLSWDFKTLCYYCTFGHAHIHLSRNKQF